VTNQNRPTIKTRNSNVAAGIDKHLNEPMIVDGSSYTPPELKAVFVAHTTALDAVDALHEQWSDQLKVAADAGRKANDLYSHLRSAIIGRFGKGANAILNDFGMKAPRPTGAKDVTTKAQAIERRAATRKARHTMGKRQKEEVTWATAAQEPATTAPASSDTAAPSGAASSGAATGAPSPSPATASTNAGTPSPASTTRVPN